MKALNEEEGVGGLRAEFNVTLGGESRRKVTATVRTTVLGDEQQGRFNAEIDNVLLQLVQQQGQKESSTCPTNTSV